MTPIQEAREALDRAVDEIISVEIPDPASPRSFARATQAIFGATCLLVSLVHKNIHLARVAEEAGADHLRDQNVLLTQKKKVLLQLRRLRNRILAKCPNLNPSVQTGSQERGPALVTDFDQMITGMLDKLDRQDSFFADGEHKAAQRLFTILGEVDPNKPQLSRWQKERSDISERLKHLRRGQRVLDESSPGKRWLSLNRIPAAANPLPDTPAQWLSDSRGYYAPDIGPLYKLLHQPNSVDATGCKEAFDWLRDLRFALKAIATEFQARLGQRASTAWILKRYARRCRRLRLRELTDMLGELGATDKRELALTRDAAVFLFDQGFEVLIEQSMGSHRYDIIGEPLLVEAKIYDGKRRGLAAVVEGLSQIHQYANDLADEGVHVDPVLLLFRLGGPRATPVSEYQIGNLRVTIAHVDLGESADSGSKASPPEPDITADDITAALERKGRRPGGKPKRRRRRD